MTDSHEPPAWNDGHSDIKSELNRLTGECTRPIVAQYSVSGSHNQFQREVRVALGIPGTGWAVVL